ncbi:MAG: cell division protein FtsZ [bacterium]|nr:cell division protein FtsZ [bacterium]
METDFNQYPAVIKIIGIGGAGGNAVNRMISFGVRGVEYIAANTDAQALHNSNAGMKLQIGDCLTKGLGVGGDPKLGRQAALDDEERIRELLAGSDMVFVTAGMGGGTGTGAAPVIAKIARELGILTIGVVTKPFVFEGKVRSMNAEEGVENLRANLDTLIVIPNQRLFNVITIDTTINKAWEQIDDVLRQSIQSISDVITSTGLVNVDFNDVKAIMFDAGEAIMGMGESSGESRALRAAEMAITSKLLEDISIHGARGVLVNITGSNKLTMHEINDAMTLIHNTVSSEANVFFGQVVDESMDGRIKVTVIATNFDRGKKVSDFPKEPQQQDLFTAQDEEKKGASAEFNLEEPAFLRKRKSE